MKIINKNVKSPVVYLITGAFQDAINDIKLSLEPTADKFAKVSSHNEIFEARNREIINKTLLNG